MTFYDKIDKRFYYEVTAERTGRLHLETVSLDEAKQFVRMAWERRGAILKITEVER